MRLSAVRALLVLVLIAAGSRPRAATSEPAPWVLGYWVGYQADLMPVEEIPWSALTHIAVGPMVPRDDGTLDASMMIAADAATNYARQVAREAVAHGVTPILMIGGGGVAARFFHAASRHRRKFVGELLALARDLGFAGFDLDYEGDCNDPAGQRMLRTLVRGLRRASPDAVLTFPAIPVTTTAPQPDAVAFYARLTRRLDHVFIQTYQMARPYPGWVSWHSSPLHGADTAAYCASNPCKPTAIDFTVDRFLAARIPAAKLGLGVGFYGTCWNGVTGPDQSIAHASVRAADNAMSYTNIVALYRPFMTEAYDSVAEAAYLWSRTPVGAHDCTFVSYETPTSIAAKAAYARARGLSGTMVWTINEAHHAPDHVDADGVLRETHSAFTRSQAR